LIYISKTKTIPKFGGEYIEGIAGQPQYINPVISKSNTTDEDLAQLIYSGIFKYDNEGKLINDLAESYEISEDKKLYTIHLKEGVLWHDGIPFTANDVLFTFNIIVDPAYKSPDRFNWDGVTANVLDNRTIVFQTEHIYVGLLNNLTFGILPKHIWEPIGPDKFFLTDLNLQPIGTGPYKFSPPIQKDSRGNIISYKLVANPNYFGGKPYISKITFNFYQDDETLIDRFNQKEIMGINSVTAQEMKSIKLIQSVNFHQFSTLRYLAVFFNKTKSVPLAYKEVREALALSTNREEIVREVLDNKADIIYSPILHEMNGFTEDFKKYEFNLDQANKILDDAGWARGEDGIRSKNEIKLEFNLITLNTPELVKTAEFLKNQWEKIGIRVNINSYSGFDIQQNYIRPREYDAVLFGHSMTNIPDLFSFWHSSEKKDSGKNLSLFGDNTTDKLIEESRIEFDEQKRNELYKQFQQKLAEEIPAIFLYSPDYIYPVNKSVRGIEIKNISSASKRFSNIEKWYIKTKRVWK